jgi:hypothetical protein
LESQVAAIADRDLANEPLKGKLADQ